VLRIFAADHYSLLRAPAVEQLAAAVRECLEEAGAVEVATSRH
jgi:8-oxo-dGTP pyrophosphatase MutT (NUDIX family)